MSSLYDQINDGEIDLSSFTSNNYLFVFERCPNLPFQVQTITFPDLTSSMLRIPRPHFAATEYDPGTTIDYGTLRMSILLDEEMKCYREIMAWIEENVRTTNFSDHACDGAIIITTNAKNPFLRMRIENMVPNTINGFDLDSRNPDPITFQASFNFTKFSLVPFQKLTS